MSQDETPGDSPDTTAASTSDQLQPHINQAQGQANALEKELPPTYAREIEHLDTDLSVLEGWADDAEDQGVEALAGAPTVVGTAQRRVQYLQDEVGHTGQNVETILGHIEEALSEIEAVITGLEITTTAYVTYVNKAFADRYFDADLQISTLIIAGVDDENIENTVDDYGLFPMDGLYGESVEDLAFPANREVDLGQDHRTYWMSTSDGGKIA